MNERKYCLKWLGNFFFFQKRAFMCRSTILNTSVPVTVVEGTPILYVTVSAFKKIYLHSFIGIHNKEF